MVIPRDQERTSRRERERRRSEWRPEPLYIDAPDTGRPRRESNGSRERGDSTPRGRVIIIDEGEEEQAD